MILMLRKRKKLNTLFHCWGQNPFPLTSSGRQNFQNSSCCLVLCLHVQTLQLFHSLLPKEDFGLLKFPEKYLLLSKGRMLSNDCVAFFGTNPLPGISLGQNQNLDAVPTTFPTSEASGVCDL